MYHATSVQLVGLGFLPVTGTAVKAKTIEECLRLIGIRPGEIAAIWEPTEYRTDAEITEMLRTERPDMAVTRHVNGFVMTLHEEHLAEFVAPATRKRAAART